MAFVNQRRHDIAQVLPGECLLVHLIFLTGQGRRAGSL
jgi:hypothetical protein